MGTTSKVLVGAPTSFSVAAYLTAKATSLTYTDVGYTMGGVSIDPKTELHNVSVDQTLGYVAALPKARDLDIKVKFGEANLENVQFALAQATANLSGTTTLIYNASDPEIYYQLRIIGKGLGATAVRTITIWRAYVKDMGAWSFKKDSAQEMDMTYGVCEETTGSTTSGSYMRIVET